MITRLTTAYGKFSRQLNGNSGLNLSEKLARGRPVKGDSNPSVHTEIVSRREAQVEQLRTSGTLDNLQSILDESERALLQKLFPEKLHRYEQDGHAVTDASLVDREKGKSIDKTL